MAEERSNQPLTRRGDPAEDVQRGTTDVVNIRVGSESAVDSGLEPVLPVGGNLSEATKIYNRDLKARHDKEIERRGLGNPLAEDVTVSFGGLRVVKVDDQPEDVKSGGGTFRVRDSLSIRRLTPEEEEQFGPGAQVNRRSTDSQRGAVTTSRGVSARNDDLVTGSGAGGGGNPMIAGQARGATSETAARTGTGKPAVTSTAEAERDQAEGRPSAPAGGGRDTRK